jgi:hypothetical protein
MLANATYKAQADAARPAANQLLLHLPLRTVSETNAHEHWRARQKRAKLHRGWVAIAFSGPHARQWLAEHGKAQRFIVTITRLGKRLLDSDNLASSQKAVRDGIADALGIDDGSDRFDWRYEQKTGKEYGVEVAVEAHAP